MRFLIAVPLSGGLVMPEEAVEKGAHREGNE